MKPVTSLKIGISAENANVALMCVKDRHRAERPYLSQDMSKIDPKQGIFPEEFSKYRKGKSQSLPENRFLSTTSKELCHSFPLFVQNTDTCPGYLG